MQIQSYYYIHSIMYSMWPPELQKPYPYPMHLKVTSDVMFPIEEFFTVVLASKLQ